MSSSKEIVNDIQKKYPAINEQESKYLNFCLNLLERDIELSSVVYGELRSLASRLKNAKFPVDRDNRNIVWALLIGIMTDMSQIWNQKYSQMEKVPFSWSTPIEKVQRFPEISEVI